MLLILALMCFAAAAYFVGEVATLPSRERRTSMRRAVTYGLVRVSPTGELARFSDRVITPAAQRLAAGVLRLNPKTTVESVSLKLLAAGLSARVSPTSFLALKGAFAFGGVFLGFVLGASGLGTGGVLLAPVLAVIGFLLPDVLVSLKTRSRKERIRADLPDALDLLAVSVEAGLGFDGAIAQLTEHMEGPLADELGLTLGEMRIGESRQEALKKLADRVPTPELTAFVRSIIQADQLGISLGRILRVQASDTRLRRQAAAEERAMKAPIKMLFPTVVFIFPAMFLVILGPALLNLMKLLK